MRGNESTFVVKSCDIVNMPYLCEIIFELIQSHCFLNRDQASRKNRFHFTNAMSRKFKEISDLTLVYDECDEHPIFAGPYQGPT